MKPNLNYWQTALLFIPFTLGVVLTGFHFDTDEARQLSFRTINVLFNLNICLALAYQAWLCIGFNNSSPRKATWFSINALVPVAFMCLYFLSILYYTYIKPYHVNLSIAPAKRIDRHLSSIIIMIFLLYAAINFYAVNTPYVSAKIKKVEDPGERERLTVNFLNPMRRLVRVSLMVIVGLILIAGFIDFIQLSSKPLPSHH